MAYIVSVMDSDFRIEIIRTRTGSAESVFELLVDGKPVTVSVVELADPSHISLIINNHSYDVALEDGIVLVEGLSFEVDVQDELRKKLAVVTKAGAKEARTEIKAPMPGLVLAVEVSPGEEVSSGQGLIILEAMKMQNELKAPRNGVVKEVLVKQGTKVNSSDLLLVIE